ncbi:hypothetical protein NESM_000917700 [Novymonas esmeraldas]|uniref:Uncharacterized protein n=1 Tax=Novymonas esmeraldas TaxID=1808958 RepID=A0AAW0F0V7_9TRYP
MLGITPDSWLSFRYMYCMALMLLHVAGMEPERVLKLTSSVSSRRIAPHAPGSPLDRRLRETFRDVSCDSPAHSAGSAPERSLPPR